MLETRDGGGSWQPLLAGVPVTAVAHTPDDPQRLLAYAAVPDQGLLVSADGGQSWTPAGLALGDDAVGHIAVHPHDLATVYVGTFGEVLYRTTDAGESWQPLAEVGQPRGP